MPPICDRSTPKWVNKQASKQEKKLPAGTKRHIMHRHLFLRRAAVFAVAATAGVVGLLPARAQTPRLIATPAALTSPAPRPPACVIAAEQVRFDVPLVRVARLLASGEPIKMVALGSSSTFGAGASTPPIRAGWRRNFPVISLHMRSR